MGCSSSKNVTVVEHEKIDKKKVKKRRKIKKPDISHSSYDFESVDSDYDGPDVII